MKNIGQSRYGLIDSGMFGVRIVAGIVTGIRYTEGNPVYEISFGKDKWWTSEITDSRDKIPDMLKLVSLEKIEKTHGLLIKYT